MPSNNPYIETVGTQNHIPTPTPNSVSLNDVAVWLAFAVGIMLFIGGCWKAISWAVSTLNRPVVSQLEKHELRITHLEDGHKSIKDEVNALRSEIKSEFRDLKDDMSARIDRLTDTLLNKK